jgi:hypothetical protein
MAVLFNFLVTSRFSSTSQITVHWSLQRPTTLYNVQHKRNGIIHKFLGVHLPPSCKPTLLGYRMGRQ